MQPAEEKERHIRYCVGVDLGKKRDPTAIAVIETRYDESNVGCYVVKYIKRLRLGLLYADVATKVATLDAQLRADAQKKGVRCSVTYILDSTGVGEGVSEMIINALPNADIRKCYLTGGINHSEEGRQIRLPKTQLVSTLVAALEGGRVRLTKRSKEIDAMVDELLNYDIHVSEEGHDQYGAFKTGTHDDLVCALGMACWWAIWKKKDTLLDSIYASEVLGDTSEGAIHPGDDYRIGWVPARGDQMGALAVYNVDHGSVISFQRLKHQTVQDQIDKVFQTAQRYEAAVWAQAGTDEAILKVLIRRGAPVKRVEMTPEEWTSAYENLSLLASYEQIKLPNDPELLSEIEAGHTGSVMALSLVTYNIHPEIEAKRYRQIPSDVHSWLRGIDDKGYYKEIDLDDLADYLNEDEDY
ncbi:MAG: hypothetical protein WBZ42_03550 [Halobacteriota archaeon]